MYSGLRAGAAVEKAHAEVSGKIARRTGCGARRLDEAAVANVRSGFLDAIGSFDVGIRAGVDGEWGSDGGAAGEWRWLLLRKVEDALVGKGV